MSYIKIAFFVEGYTEQQFVRNILIEIFGIKKIAIEIQEVKGGKKVSVSYTKITSASELDSTKYFVLIYNCNGDSSIKSYILEQRSSLIKAGYSKVIGLRDVYPDITREQISRLRDGLKYGVPQKDLQISFVLSIMEIEAWFLSEEFHFSKINVKLTFEHLWEKFEFDPRTQNTENIDEAANLLKAIYASVGMTYKKEKAYIDRTINKLDFGNIYLEVRNRNTSLNELISEFESVLI
jgi:hypothetical protein